MEQHQFEMANILIVVVLAAVVVVCLAVAEWRVQRNKKPFPGERESKR